MQNLCRKLFFFRNRENVIQTPLVAACCILLLVPFSGIVLGADLQAEEDIPAVR
jgi:hypothetical protein